MVNFSAAQLVKQSAIQLLYIHINKIVKPPTPAQTQGDIYANNIAQCDGADIEKRGIYKLKDITIFFCIDYVKDNLFVEIKSLKNEDQFESWYLSNSIL
jgi:hypothetical protein